MTKMCLRNMEYVHLTLLFLIYSCCRGHPYVINSLSENYDPTECNKGVDCSSQSSPNTNNNIPLSDSRIEATKQGQYISNIPKATTVTNSQFSSTSHSQIPKSDKIDSPSNSSVHIASLIGIDGNPINVLARGKTESSSIVAPGENLRAGNSSEDRVDDRLESFNTSKPPSWSDNVKWDEIYDQPTPEEAQKINNFDPSRLNYTALRIAIDDWLYESSVSRNGRFLKDTHLPSFLTNLGQMLDFEQLVTEVETSIMSSMSCNACRGGMGLLQHYIKTGKTRDEIIYAASKLCSSFKIETPRVCYGIINLMADEVIYVAKNVFMTPDEVCGFVIGDICGDTYNPYHDWRVTFPPVPKPPIKPWVPHQGGIRNLKVLHLSDTHFDPDYLEGTNAECGEPICCRATSGAPENPKDAAGYWGDYRKCDTPKRTIYNMFENIMYMHPDIDYILWTGDLPPHDVWNQTRESNTNVLRETVNQLLTFFPNTPIFPALGNHESAPVNSFPPEYVPEEFGIGWLYRELYNHWSRWLPKETGATILKGGFYSVLVRPGFRILSINTNFCNNKNWWLLVNSTDPAQELQWLIYELQGAELRNEKVHIIGHIPPGHNDCLKVWSHNYYSIINRYESTISAQFFGHTHFDEFEVFYDEYRPRRAINVAYIGPSVTSYYGLNPGYRLYAIEGDFEGSSKAVMDHETWVMDLEEANKGSRPRWYQLYSARRAYGLRSLHPQEWDILINRMTEDDDLFDLYHRFYWKESPAKESCNKDCKKRLLCDLKSGRSHDRKVTCAKVNEKVEAQERMSWGGWLFSGLTVTSLATWWLWG